MEFFKIGKRDFTFIREMRVPANWQGRFSQKGCLGLASYLAGNPERTGGIFYSFDFLFFLTIVSRNSLSLKGIQNKIQAVQCDAAELIETCYSYI